MPNKALLPKSLQRLGQAANQAAARQRFADYQSRRAEHTLRRQQADLALFAQFLSGLDVAVGQLASDPQAGRASPGAWWKPSSNGRSSAATPSPRSTSASPPSKPMPAWPRRPARSPPRNMPSSAPCRVTAAPSSAAWTRAAPKSGLASRRPRRCASAPSWPRP